MLTDIDIDTVRIRWVIRRDMDEVQCIAHNSNAEIQGEAALLACLRQRNCIGMVAEAPDDRVLAYMVYELHETHLHIIDLAVCPTVRRHGIGTRMVAKLASKLSSERRTHITVEVRETNLAGQLFLRACGFRATGVLRGHYGDTNEDAYAMTYRFDD